MIARLMALMAVIVFWGCFVPNAMRARLNSPQEADFHQVTSKVLAAASYVDEGQLLATTPAHKPQDEADLFERQIARVSSTAIARMKFAVQYPGMASRDMQGITLDDIPKVASANPQPVPLQTPRPVVVLGPHQLAVKVTGYSSSRNETDDSPTITAWNTTTQHGVVANNCLPLGTVIEIKSVRGLPSGEYRVEDTMNARYGCDRIDVWRPSKWAARSVATQEAIVRVVKYGAVQNPRAKEVS